MTRATTTMVLALALLLALAGCEKPIDVRARITDSQGRGIPGAIFYAEAWQYNSGAYDFVWGVADSSGTVTSVDGKPMTLRWRSGAKMGVAVMAPGKHAFAVNDYTNALEPTDLELTLNDLSDTVLQWEPKLAKLSFPFESENGLSERLIDSTCLPLLEGFLAEYGHLTAGRISATSEEKSKMQFLGDLVEKLTKK